LTRDAQATASALSRQVEILPASSTREIDAAFVSLQTFDAARDEWSAMEAVVHLELLLEAEGLLIEERTTHASPPGQDRFRAA
jgi:hypothetical protein